MNKEKALKMSSTLLFLSAIYFFIKVGLVVLSFALVFGMTNTQPLMMQNQGSFQLMMMSGFMNNISPNNFFPMVVSSLAFLTGGILLVLSAKKIKIALNTFVWSLVSLVSILVIFELTHFNLIILYLGLFASLVTLYFSDRK